MSGAQPKAADIAGAVSITAEVDLSRIETRQRAGLGAAGHRRSRAGILLGGRLRAPPARLFRSPTTATWSICGSTRWTTTCRWSWPPIRPPATPPTTAATCRRAWTSTRLARAAAPPTRRSTAAGWTSRCARQIELIGDHGRAAAPTSGTTATASSRRCSRRACTRWPPTAPTPRRASSIPQLRGAHHGAALLRPGLRAVPLGLLQPRPGRPRRHRRGGHELHRPGALLAGPRQLQLGARRRQEQPGGGLAGAHPLRRRRGAGAHRPGLQRPGAPGRRSGRSSSAATITTCRAPTRPTARPATSATAPTSWPTWPFTAGPATRPGA